MKFIIKTEVNKYKYIRLKYFGRPFYISSTSELITNLIALINKCVIHTCRIQNLKKKLTYLNFT